jgi:hypothetical protein
MLCTMYLVRSARGQEVGFGVFGRILGFCMFLWILILCVVKKFPRGKNFLDI